jgi:hypothetical protein
MDADDHLRGGIGLLMQLGVFKVHVGQVTVQRDGLDEGLLRAGVAAQNDIRTQLLGHLAGHGDGDVFGATDLVVTLAAALVLVA